MQFLEILTANPSFGGLVINNHLTVPNWRFGLPSMVYISLKKSQNIHLNNDLIKWSYFKNLWSITHSIPAAITILCIVNWTSTSRSHLHSNNKSGNFIVLELIILKGPLITLIGNYCLAIKTLIHKYQS